MKSMQSKYLLCHLMYLIFSLSGQVYCTRTSARLRGDRICDTESCRELAQILQENIDTRVDPCQDFYEFSCGSARRARSVLRGHRSINALNESSRRKSDRLKRLVNLPFAASDSVDLVQMKNFYISCETQAEGINKREIIDLLQQIGGLPLLAELTGWKDCSSCVDWIYVSQKLRDIGLSYQSFFRMKLRSNRSVQFDFLPKKLTRNWSDDKVEREINKNRLLLQKLGVEPSESIERQLNDMIRFRVELANIYANQSLEKFSVISISELYEKLPQFDWLRLAQTIRGNSNPVGDIDIFKPIDLVAALMHRTSPKILINHMIMLSLEDLAESLGLIEFRVSHCLDLIATKMPNQISREYIRRYVSPEVKASAAKIVKILKRHYVKLIIKISWLSIKAEIEAAEIVESVNVLIASSIGFLEQTEEVEINSDNFFANLLALNRALDALAAKSALDDIVYLNSVSAQHFGSYYYSNNQMSILALALDSILLDKTRPIYANMALFGSLVASELGHVFDKGVLEDDRRSIGAWWEPNDEVEYLQRTTCLRDQIGAVDWPELGYKVDPEKVLFEMTADQIGINLLYSTYRKMVKNQPEEPLLPGVELNQAQLFWVTHATLWCNSLSPEETRQKFSDSPHLPYKMRLNLPLSNMPQFAEDFKCPLGSPMNPERKCLVFEPEYDTESDTEDDTDDDMENITENHIEDDTEDHMDDDTGDSTEIDTENDTEDITEGDTEDDLFTTFLAID